MSTRQGVGYPVRSRVERFRGSVFQVVTDRVEMPGGDVVDRDYIVHIGAVGVVAVDDDDRVVLIRQYRAAMGRELWELPAGLADVSGEPALDAAARELAEEADLAAASWTPLVEIHTSPGCSDERIQIFLALGLKPVPDVRRHARTHEEAGLQIHRIPLDEAVAMVLAGEITNAACAIGLLAAVRTLTPNPN